MTPALNPLDRIRPDVRAMHAYVVQGAEGMLKLDAMENPFGLPPALQAALGQRLGSLALNRYPGTRNDDLRAALARHAGMPEGHALILGNGSDELISLVSLACALPPALDGQRPVVLAPVPGFVMYAMSAQLQGLDFVGVPLTPDFELDEAAMLGSVWAVLKLGDAQKRAQNFHNAFALYNLAALLGDWQSPVFHMQTGMGSSMSIFYLSGIPELTAGLLANMQRARQLRGLPPIVPAQRPHVFNMPSGSDPIGVYPRRR